MPRASPPPARARAAGTTHKVLLYYFDGADDLLSQAILQLRERRIGKAQAGWLMTVP